eukprot:gene8707-653_t
MSQVGYAIELINYSSNFLRDVDRLCKKIMKSVLNIPITAKTDLLYEELGLIHIQTLKHKRVLELTLKLLEQEHPDNHRNAKLSELLYYQKTITPPLKRVTSFTNNGSFGPKILTALNELDTYFVRNVTGKIELYRSDPNSLYWNKISELSSENLFVKLDVGKFKIGNLSKGEQSFILGNKSEETDTKQFNSC